MSDFNNFFLDGMRWLNRRQETASAVEIEYDALDFGVFAIRAVVGKVDQKTLNESRLDTGSFMFDFIIFAEDLPRNPIPGDKIRCFERTFEVSNLIAGRAFDYVDSAFEALRTHTQLVD